MLSHPQAAAPEALPCSEDHVSISRALGRTKYMPLMAADPPRTLPLGQVRLRFPRYSWGCVMYCQSYGVPTSPLKYAWLGISMRERTASPVSPASSTRTVLLASSDNLEAKTRPARPPPAMTKSYEAVARVSQHWNIGPKRKHNGRCSCEVVIICLRCS